ncbi:hypothetical protein D3C81_1623040 [compost metagenome]
MVERHERRQRSGDLHRCDGSVVFTRPCGVVAEVPHRFRTLEEHLDIVPVVVRVHRDQFTVGDETLIKDVGVTGQVSHRRNTADGFLTHLGTRIFQDAAGITVELGLMTEHFTFVRRCQRSQ